MLGPLDFVISVGLIHGFGWKMPDPAPGPATPQNDGIGNINFILGKSVKPYPDLVFVSSNALSMKAVISRLSVT